MRTQDSSFFLDGALPDDDREVDPLRQLKPWHRIAICVAFCALMVVYLGWLTQG